jgi:hypothetical protein
MTFFDGFKTVEAIKLQYRKLAREHHPDLGGDEEVMKAVNAAYHQVLEKANGQEMIGADGKTHRYNYNPESEQAIMDKIRELLGLGMVEVEVLLIGLWVWIKGDTKPYKTELKGIGCRWHSKRGCWYWKPYEGRSYGSPNDLDGLAKKYGCESFGRTAIAG